jgi:hypothetical protein
MGRDMVALALPLMPPLSGWCLLYGFMVELKRLNFKYIWAPLLVVL